MELSSVQHNTAKSAQLADAVAAFLAQGGSVSTLQGFVQTPKPPAARYGRKFPAEPRSKPTPPRKLKRPAPVQRTEIPQDMQERLRALALTMTRYEAAKVTGLSEFLVARFARENAVEFKRRDMSHNLKPPKIDPVADAMNVVRIKAACAQGLARKQAAAALGLSRALVERLIADYNIDFPKRPTGKRR
jgi:hypothetical protein